MTEAQLPSKQLERVRFLYPLLCPVSVAEARDSAKIVEQVRLLYGILWASRERDTVFAPIRRMVGRFGIASETSGGANLLKSFLPWCSAS